MPTKRADLNVRHCVRKRNSSPIHVCDHANDVCLCPDCYENPYQVSDC